MRRNTSAIDDRGESNTSITTMDDYLSSVVNSRASGQERGLVRSPRFIVYNNDPNAIQQIDPTFIRSWTQPFNVFSENFEEDSSNFTSIAVNEESLLTEFSGDEVSCSIPGLHHAKLKWINKNCRACESVAGEDFSKDNYNNIVAIKVLSDKKFSKGHCVLKDELKKTLQIDKNLGFDEYEMPITPTTIFSLWSLKTQQAFGSTAMGLGSAPLGKLVVKLPLSFNMYITLGSAIRILQGNTNVLYAIPIFGGKRRRIGNVYGRTNIVSTLHGQVPGSLIYKLYTKKDIKKGVNAEEHKHDFYVENDVVCERYDQILSSDASYNTKMRAFDCLLDYIIS